MKTIFKFLLWLIILFVLAFALFLGYISMVDYSPDEKEQISQNLNAKPIEKDTLSFMIWNIGYAGLGAEMDFFYDGGTKVRPSKEMSRKYMDGIKKFISTDSIDYWLFQEVDVKAKRSHYKNEVDEIIKLMSDYESSFAKNYDVPFVPVPVYEPMGFVEGGMITLSKFISTAAERHAYPLIASWQNKLFLLDRCFILTRYPLRNDKELVVLNTHNSAYVYDSALRLKELQIIKAKMIEEYIMGNFVIAGGDWNANPPQFSPSGDFNGHKFVPSVVQMNEKLFPDQWKWVYDPSAPTNRKNYKAFTKGDNETTYIDYYIVSPNVEVLDIKTFDLNFENSDHNPVYLKAGLAN